MLLGLPVCQPSAADRRQEGSGLHGEEEEQQQQLHMRRMMLDPGEEPPTHGVSRRAGITPEGRNGRWEGLRASAEPHTDPHRGGDGTPRQAAQSQASSYLMSDTRPRVRVGLNVG